MSNAAQTAAGITLLTQGLAVPISAYGAYRSGRGYDDFARVYGELPSAHQAVLILTGVIASRGLPSPKAPAPPRLAKIPS